ncbi:MAG: NAD(P)/FAD-dependent oxidoreductase [Myxococcales bacterium]|nr:NAD(P)/FAD-dependent oxidoreductase [Myxococcales bacterium]
MSDGTAGRADLVVVGAGPAGITAALAAAKRGRRVTLLEKAARPGVKILISGGNRCNLTHDCEAAEIAKAYGRAGGRFLGHALRELGPRELRAWVESLGVATKVEPGGKVFPVSDRAVEVRDALEAELTHAGVEFVGSAAVEAVEREGETFVVVTADRELRAPRLVLAVGGRSYPKVGTTGDGYAFARALGHTVTTTAPALVPLVTTTTWVRELSGVTLEDVVMTLSAPANTGAKRPITQRGALLFTHFGLSGPAPMNLGGSVAEQLVGSVASVTIAINFLPTTERKELDARFVTAMKDADPRLVRTAVTELLPRRVAEMLCEQANLAPNLLLAQFGAAARARLLDALFATRLSIAGTRGFDFAEVTRGGVPLDEVDPATLQSRRVPGLYLAGELLDLDGPIGGYNFTAAFATGALAGRCAAEA